MRDTMVQSSFAIRIGRVALACVSVLGAGLVLVSCTRTTNGSEAVPTAPVATTKVDEALMTASPPVAGPATAGLDAEAQAREASWRESREVAIRVQQRLRAQEQARKSAQQEEGKNERCVDGLRMKRVDNGWVQAGNC
jgi:hypothetical protein